jgi:Reverse transcriptase (RNA-dependent DNA polymerase)/Endonuclease-reverse transcriptase
VTDALLTISGYELQHDLRMDRNDTGEGRGGGLLVYSKQGLKILASDNNSQFNQFCSFEVYDTTLYLVYRPPNSSQQNTVFLADLIRNAAPNSILIGDFNLPGVDWETGEARPNERPVVEAVQDALMDQMVDFSTHLRGNVLDLVLTNIPNRVTDLREEGRLGKSDHSMLVIEVSVNAAKSEPAQARPDWAKADWNKARSMLNERGWQNAVRREGAVQAWENLKAKIQEVVAECVPLRRRRNGNRPPWMSQEIMRAIRRKKRLWARDKNRPDKTEYKEQEKKVRNLIRNGKRKFEKRLADGGQSNKRPFYAYVKSRTKTRQSVGPLRTENGEKVADNLSMAGLLNETFGRAFTRENTANVPDPDQQHHGPELRNLRVTTRDVIFKIKRLRREAAAGPDGIGPAILLETCKEIAPVLASIFNKSIESGDIPSDWKEANVAPIFKKGSRAEPANYRPVSLTSVSCKLLESIIKDKILHHLKRNNLLRGSQHGFLPGRNCTSNLLAFLEKATAAVDGGQSFDAVFLDFAKAFDKVPRARLLKKVRAHGVSGQLLRWIQNWLTGRRQRVVVNGSISEWIEVLSGVPQGSVLGPLLFLIFINDIDAAAETVEILLKFADDTKVGQTIRTEQDRAAMQAALDRLCKWTEDWGMSFNVAKCKVIHFGRNNPEFEYQMLGQRLEKVDKERDIGVMVHKSLKPAAQCAKAAGTARAVLGQISRAFHYRDKDIFVKLYKTYVRPHLEFCTPAWSPWNLTDIDCLEKVQVKMLNMVTGLVSDTYEGKLAEVGLQTLAERRHVADMITVHKLAHGVGDLNIFELFDRVPGRQNTRAGADPLNVRPRPATLELRRGFFSYRAAMDWNNIPANVKSLPVTGQFKEAYKKLRATLQMQR